MAQGIDSAAVAEYLAQVRGANITPEFTNVGLAPGQTSFDPGNIGVSMNPLTEDVETEEEKERREEEERREQLRIDRQSAADFQDLEALRVARDNNKVEFKDAVAADQTKYEAELGIPELRDKRDAYSQLGGAVGLELSRPLNAEIDERMAMVKRKLSFDDKGQLVGSESAKFNDYINFDSELATREKTLTKDDVAKRQELAEDKRLSKQKSYAAEQRIEDRLLKRGITHGIREMLNTFTGKTWDATDLSALNEDSVKFLEKAYSSKPGDTVISADDLSLMSDQTRGLASIFNEKNALNSRNTEAYNKVVGDMSTLIKVSDAQTILDAEEKRSVTSIQQRDALLEAKKKKKRMDIVDNYKAEYKEKNLTVDMFNPAGKRVFDEGSEYEAAMIMYNSLMEIGLSDRLVDSTPREILEIKNYVIQRALQVGGHPYKVSQAAWEKMLDEVANEFNTKHSDISGASVGSDDPILSMWRYLISPTSRYLR